MIDWKRISELQEEVGEEDFAEILEMFFEEVEEALDGLPDADDKGKKGGLHFLKGAALNIGMVKVSNICLAAELALKQDSAVALNLQEIRSAIETSQAELKEMLG